MQSITPTQREQIQSALDTGDKVAALHYAAAYGETDTITRLLNQRVDINAVDDDGCSAICLAAGRGQDEASRILIEAEADVNLVNKEGVSPLMYGAWLGNGSVVKLLLDAGADVSAQSRITGRTALSCAEGKGHDAVAELLIQHGAAR